MTANLPATATVEPPFAAAVAAASGRVAPLWPLSRFVAVNPFVGLAGLPFLEAGSLLGRNAGISLAMPSDFYRERFQRNEITADDLALARQQLLESVGEAASVPTVDQLLTSLATGRGWSGPRQSVFTFAEVLDAVHGSRWAAFVTEEISKWCAAYFDQGQALWRMPWSKLPLYQAWKQAASFDRNPVAAGIRGWNQVIASLADEPAAEIARASAALGIDAGSAAELYHRELLSVSGWAGHLQFRAHERKLHGGTEDTLTHLLAIRLAFDAGLQFAFGAHEGVRQRWEDVLAAASEPAVMIEVPAGAVWQRAHECARQRQLFARFNAHRAPSTPARSTFQAVFCIDVRSEVFRRALEQVAPEGQTVGFAGFFGFPIEAVPVAEPAGTPQCPVLLTPVVPVPAAADERETRRVNLVKRARESWTAFKSSAVSSFVFVDTAGLAFGAKLARDLAHHTPAPACTSCGVDVSGIPIATQVKLAAGALRHMGFASGGLARVVLLCGHGSQTANNPFGSSLDCGACGGHTGESNVRTAVAILNSPAVREGLKAEGIDLPDDTVFVAGLHNTTTDDVTLFGLAPSSHAADVSALEKALAQAGELARAERAPALGLAVGDARSACEKIRTRAHDWAQVRPEWGLAGNYAFIATRRERTRGLDLGGRAFLHDYDYARDAGEATLELLLAAPVVVASWINLQYFGSTVDNARLGSGNKVLHNVASALGVYEGNGGDLRVGLPLQSVHDGKEWRHEPLRLHVCVEAPREAMDRVLVKHPEVAALVANEWIHLFAIDADGQIAARSNGKGGWRTL